MAEGWIQHPGERHHGAHGGLAARALGVPEEDLLDFSQNVNPLGPPAGALAAAREALVREAGRYPDLDYPKLREALAGYLGVSPGIVLPTNGGAEALFLAARAAARPGGSALVLEPTFSEYTAAARAAGLEPVRRVARVPEKRRLRFDPSALEDLDGVALVFLCNPNNPTGDALSKREVLEVAHRVWAAGAALVVDEAFADFLPEASVAGNVEEGLYVARSFTKFFAVPGLRLGCLLAADPGKAQAFQPSWSVNVVAAAAGIAAYVEASLVEVTRLRRELLASLNALPALAAFAGAANFLLVRGPEGLPERLARRGVLVRGCEPFMGLGAGYFRVAVRGAEENGRLLEALREEL
ncbi:MAG: aminotransferase class I/II-fold pyridoxal phosphate-dependent enzyme [Actinobacteria bacterium]|nr:aminotransferase class I/II-fold pyridoxal phosphate-dependent enzyme [Actinomycetota bacterium]